MKRTLWLLLLLLPLGFFLKATDIPKPMSPARLVNDYVGLFSASQQETLEQKLVEFDRATSSQIAVVVVPDLGSEAISSYAVRLFEQWGIGGSKNDNGILILLKPKSVSERGEVFIATGYGLEGVLPDALAGRIVNQEMIPFFKQNDYFTGVDHAVNALIEITKGEYTAEQYMRQGELSALEVFFLVVAVLLFIIIGAMSNNRRRGSFTASSGGAVVPPIFFGGFGGDSRSGGFGGFGGGMTGGGGAGGSW